ncbi:MAG TPA: GntR family transcriptional regulator [Methylomirabilota bacterium]|jgi:GntR family transcriptional regulator|nr:GntR family transcriptional regulator [Methylomirabilota bacterium]
MTPARDVGPPAPRYLTVTEALRAEITAAPPNTLLPTEQQLARRFGVSRLTLRRALGLLERGGLVSRQRGRGTIVSPAKISRLLAPLYTLEEDLRRQGLKLETRVLRYEPSTEPPDHVRQLLQLRRRSGVAVVELLRLVDGQVIAHDLAYVPTPLAARFRPEEVGDPLLEVLRDRARVRLGRLEWEIEILPSGPEVARALGITSGVLVVASRATAYSRAGAPVSRSERCYRIDRVKFHVASQDPADTAGGGKRAARARGTRPTTR